MALKANWAKLRSQAKQLAKSGGSGRSEFMKLDKDNLKAHVRLVLFENKEGEGELSIEVGTHFGLENFGATERFSKDGKIETRPIKAAKCPAITHAQYDYPELADLLRTIDQERGYICSPEEIQLLAQHCMLCAMAESFIASDDVTERKMGFRMRASRRHLMNVVDRAGDGDGKYQLFEAPPSVIREIMETLMNPHYEGRIFDADDVHEFELKLAITPARGGRPRYEYSVQVLPERVPLGEPDGQVTKLSDPGWRDNVLFAWDVDAQTLIVEGKTVARPKRDDADPDVPKPRCYDQAMKDESTAQCKQCAWATKCDNGEADKPEEAKAKVNIAERGRNVFSSLLANRKKKTPAKPAEKAPEPVEEPDKVEEKPKAAPEPAKAPEVEPGPPKVEPEPVKKKTESKAVAASKKAGGSILDRLRAAKTAKQG